jgi:hypothetical protein
MDTTNENGAVPTEQKDWRKMLTDIGGYENEMVSVPAGGVRSIIDEVEMLRARVAPAPAGDPAGWVDQFGNVFPLSAYSPTGKANYHDAHKRGWEPLYRSAHPTIGWRYVPIEPTEAMVHAGEDVPVPRPFGQVYRAMLDAAPIPPLTAPVPQTSWQPIESAPKDGRTLLLGCFNTLGRWRTMRGQWFSEAAIAEDWEDPDDAEEGWYETAVEPDVPNCWSIAPSHWMPLPVAPEVTPIPQQSQVHPESAMPSSTVETMDTNDKRRAEDAERLPAEELEWVEPKSLGDLLMPKAQRDAILARDAAPAVDAAELGKLPVYEFSAFENDDRQRYALLSDVAALVAQLEAENDRLRLALVDKVMAQTMLHELCIKDGGINMRYSGGAAQLLAEAFGEQFESSGATNYLEVGFDTSNGVRLLVTLQRCDGKTPATLKTEADALVALQAARIEQMEDAADQNTIELAVAKDSLAQQAARIAEMGKAAQAARDATDEGAEILDSLIDSVEKHGNYSKEATLTFLGQLKQCFNDMQEGK